MVVVVVGVVRRHLLDAGGDAPHRLLVRVRGRPAPRPPLSGPPSPPGSHAPSRLSLGAHGALALAIDPPSGPLPVPWVLPPVPHALACPLAHPLPALCPPSAAAPLLRAARALARSLRALLGTSAVASCPPLRAPVAGTQLCLRAVASFLDHAPGVPLSLQPRQRDTRRRALGRQGGGGAAPAPGGRAWGGTASGDWCGCGWGWRGRGTSRPPCPLLLLRRPPARRPWPMRGPSPAFAAC